MVAPLLHSKGKGKVMKREDIKVGGVYVAQVEGAECHVKVMRMLGIRWEVKVVQAPFGAHTLLGKKRTFDHARQFKSAAVEGEGQSPAVAYESANTGESTVTEEIIQGLQGFVNYLERTSDGRPDEEDAQYTPTARKVKTELESTIRKREDKKRPDPTMKSTTKITPAGTAEQTCEMDVSVTKTSADSPPIALVIERSVENPECMGYEPNLATGVCRCKSCRSKPYAGRTKRPFVSAATAAPTMLTAKKEREPTEEASAGSLMPTKKTLTQRTKEVSSSSSQDNADTMTRLKAKDMPPQPGDDKTVGDSNVKMGELFGRKVEGKLYTGQIKESPVQTAASLLVGPTNDMGERIVEGEDSAHPTERTQKGGKRMGRSKRTTTTKDTSAAPTVENEHTSSGGSAGASTPSVVTVGSSGEALEAAPYAERWVAGTKVSPEFLSAVRTVITAGSSGEDKLAARAKSFLEEKARNAGVSTVSSRKSLLPDTPLGGSGDAPHLEVMAYAGTGKSTTVVQGLIKVKGGTPKITPSDEQDAIWGRLGIGKNDSVRVSAFSNAISNEMGQKLHDAGLVGKGVEATGIHKLGFAAVRAQFGYLPPNGYAVTDLVCKKLGGEFNTLKTQKGMLVKINAVADLVSLCKQTMTAPTEQGLDQLAYRYDVELDSQKREVYELVPDVLEACKKPQGKIAFDDMIWLPVVLGLHIPKVDHQIIDESQDLNRMQQELMYLAGHRVTFVGDEHQAIMGFAGADSESMKRMYQTLAGSSVGCDRLPLTVTRRCGKAIVKEAQKYVPGFQAHESNGEGVVKYATWTWKGTGSDRVLVPWGKTYAPLVRDGAMVVCRTNAPTVSECFRFLARGIKAVVLGRKVGQGLIDLVKKAEKARDGIGEDAPVAKLIAWLSDWLTAETAKEQAKKYPSEGKIQNLEDKYECLVTFAKSDCARTSEVITRINTVFADKKCPKCGKPYDVDARVCDVPACGGVSLVLPGGVKFSSIHKSKGLEAEQVVYLCPPGTGMREDKMQAWELEQEDNLRYVAVTRAIHELIYVQ